MGILAVVLGLVAIVCAIFVSLLLGTTGGIIAGVLGVGAVVLGLLKRKKSGKGGIGGIVVGVLAVIMAFSMTNLWSGMFTMLHDKAVELKPDGMWATVTEDARGGLMGIFKKLPGDEASLNALMDEMNELMNAK